MSCPSLNSSSPGKRLVFDGDPLSGGVPCCSDSELMHEEKAPASGAKDADLALIISLSVFLNAVRLVWLLQ